MWTIFHANSKKNVFSSVLFNPFLILHDANQYSSCKTLQFHLTRDSRVYSVWASVHIKKQTAYASRASTDSAVYRKGSERLSNTCYVKGLSLHTRLSCVGSVC